MSKTNETGHSKNVANFQDLVNFVNSYAERYNPSRDAIKLAGLKKLLANAKAVIADYNNALSPYKIAAAERETAFEPLSKLTTRLLNSLKSTETTVQMDETAKSLARKIKGERASALKPTNATQQVQSTDNETKQISSAQTSYDNRLDNFSKLMLHLDNIPQFKPNEPELKIEAIKAVYNNMSDKNDQAKLAAVALSNARIARDKVLYEPITGLSDIAFDVKIYIKSAFGAISPEYKQVGGIEFKTVK